MKILIDVERTVFEFATETPVPNAFAMLRALQWQGHELVLDSSLFHRSLFRVVELLEKEGVAADKLAREDVPDLAISLPHGSFPLNDKGNLDWLAYRATLNSAGAGLQDPCVVVSESEAIYAGEGAWHFSIAPYPAGGLIFPSLDSADSFIACHGVEATDWKAVPVLAEVTV